MLEKGGKFFRVKVGTKEQVITVDRLKPAFGFADPAPQTAVKQREVKAAPPKKEVKGSLNPGAEVFVPGRKTKEKTPTTSKSRFGRTRRPPERLGVRTRH